MDYWGLPDYLRITGFYEDYRNPEEIYRNPDEISRNLEEIYY